MLKKLLVGAAAVLTLGGATLATTSPAEAYWHGGYGGWHGGYGGWRGGYGWGRGYGYGVGAGLLGVAIGASLASPYYGAPPGYYAGPGYWGAYGGCRGYWRWDPYYGHYVRGGRCY